MKISPTSRSLTSTAFLLKLFGFNPTHNSGNASTLRLLPAIEPFVSSVVLLILLLAVAPHNIAAQVKIRATNTTQSKASLNQDLLAKPARPAPQARPTPVVRPSLGPTVSFIKADTGTQGNWAGHYGAEGYNIFNDVASYPGYSQVSRVGLAAWTWQPTTEDVRALRKVSAAGRIASAWYDDYTLTISLGIIDGKRHQVAIYLLDWDYGGRMQKVEILNAETDAVLDSRTATNFSGGQYLAWNISGRVKLRLTRMAGINTVCSGIFFDTEALPIKQIDPPVISAVTSSSVTSGDAVITWVTDKAADSGIEYGSTIAYGNTTTVSSPLVINHQINLIGLMPATLYHYHVLSKDAAGNLAHSGDLTFTTATIPPPPPPVAGSGEPELPRVLLNTTFPEASGRTITVNAGGDLQAALNTAAPGDTVVVQAGATFTAPSGGFVLPSKPNAAGKWIVVCSSNLSALPASGRVNPSQASAMAKIVSADVAPAIATQAGANFWRLSGLEVTVAETALPNATAPGATTNYGLISLGSDAETNANNLPTDLAIDRCYIHGLPAKNVRRGVALNSRRTAIVDSYFADFHEIGSDSQAIACWNGPGPFKIVNNRLEGAGENVLFGGADSAVPNLVPADIEIRRNYLFKPRAWLPADPGFGGIAWTVKNLFELKNARRVLVEGNVFENNWVSGQNGFAILFTVRNQDGTAPWSTVEDVTLTNNILRHSSSAVNILGRDYIHPSGQTRRLKIKNNLFEDISSTPWGGAGRFLQITDTVDVKVENNTIFHTGNLGMSYTNLNTPANTGFVFRNNIAAHNSYGFIGDGTGTGMGTLNTYFPDAIFVGNILAGGPASAYPAGNYFPAALNDVSFVNRAGGDYHLAANSLFKNGGNDGKDPGANIDAINAATAGTVP